MGKTLVEKNTNHQMEDEARTVREKELSYIQWPWWKVSVSHEVPAENEGCDAETPRFFVEFVSDQIYSNVKGCISHHICLFQKTFTLLCKDHLFRGGEKAGLRSARLRALFASALAPSRGHLSTGCSFLKKGKRKKTIILHNLLCNYAPFFH